MNMANVSDSGNKRMNKVITTYRILIVLCIGLMLAPLSLYAEEQDTWKINMKEADIRNFIEQISDITGYSFVVDMRVKGKVTVVSHADMTAAEIFSMFQSVLRVHGYASIKSGSIYKIVPTQGAKQDNLPLAGGGDRSERMITRVIPVENTNAVELVPILRPMVPQYGHLAAVTSANALIISDHASNINRIMNIVKRIDSAESEEIEVVQLTHAWVTDVVKLLEELTPVETGGKKRGKSSGAARVRVVAEERTNRLILRGEKSARARVKGLIKELDLPVEARGSTQVIYLRHADATKLSDILRGIVTGKAVSLNKSKSSTNRGRTTTSRATASAGTSSNGITIQPDETLNALVIKADPSDMAEIRSIIDQLDVRRAQVLIEAAIIEITGTVGKGFGVQWGAVNDQSLVGGVNFSNVGNSLNSLIAAATDSASGAATGLASGITIGGGKVDSEGKVEFAMVLQAISSATNTNLLSTPSIMTLDNEEASIIVGENVPFVTGSQLSSSGDNPFQTIERKDVGLTLKITPQVSAGSTIRLQVEQETSNVTATAESINATDVVTAKREIKTTVLANDGQIIVLGGLMREDIETSESKVPILGDIPLLGVLFRSTQKKHVKRNLVVLLHPTIIRTAENANAVTARYYERAKTVQLELDDVGNLTTTGEDIYPDEVKSLIEQGLKTYVRSGASAE
ncbi:type II secretion system protein GspD [Gammaproteobacteria bacterium 42_54_T18]|nr:type II secretion system protein GspD [Gammaproteobacteria bacterium 42_54_T18]